MLIHENEPFADQHILNLSSVRNLLEKIADNPETEFFTKNEAGLAIGLIDDARRGFYRYKMCFADEVKQKETMRDRWLSNHPSPLTPK